MLFNMGRFNMAADMKFTSFIWVPVFALHAFMR
jgi:hypothetical protein